MQQRITPNHRTAVGLLAMLILSSTAPVGAATLTAYASMTDAFATAPNVIDAPAPQVVNSDVAGGSAVPSVSATARDTETGAGGSAYAKGGQHARVVNVSEPYVELGVSAAARSQGNRVGSARATAEVDFDITVTIEVPLTNDPVLLPLLMICLSPSGCPLSASFLHQTTGLFTYSSFMTQDASAQFSETLSLNSNLASAGTAGVASISGSQHLGGSPITPGVSGDWRLDDLLPAIGAPGESALKFNHFAQIQDVRAQFEDHGRRLVGRYHAHLSQEAVAGFGTSDYAFGALGADFAHTSLFTVSGLSDPISGVDLSGLQVRVEFHDLTAVPLPAPLYLLGPALLVLVGARRA